MADYPEGTVFVPVSPQLAEMMSDWSDLVRIKIVQDGYGVDMYVQRPTPTELREQADRIEAEFPDLYGKVVSDG